MIVVDINLLLYAVITGFPRHADAKVWWEQTLNSSTEVGLSSPALFGFVRLSTNPRVLKSPLTVSAALGYVRGWLGRPQVRFLTPGPNHLNLAFVMLERLGTAANLTTDVQLAAFAIENHAELHSNDTDFARFPELHWVNPLD